MAIQIERHLIPDDLRWVGYHAGWRRRFESAAARPWIAVPEEPEAPEARVAGLSSSNPSARGR